MDITLNRLAKELKISKSAILDLRDTRLKEGEWYVNKWGSTSFTDEGADKIRLADTIPLAVPKVFNGVVKSGCPNPRYVVAVLDSLPDKVKVYCAIPRRLYGRLIGKHIIIHAITDAQGNTSYRHEAC